MRVAKLPLQRARSEQAARAAGVEQQRHRLGAEIDGESPVAAKSRLVGDIGDMSAPRIGHGVDTVGAHQKPRGLHLGGGFRDLDLGCLHVAELGAIVSGSAIPCLSYIIVEASLRIAETHARQHVRE